MTFRQALRDRLGALSFRGWRVMLEGWVIDGLYAVAERERRAPEQVAADLLAIALAERQKAELTLDRWRQMTLREREITALICLKLTNQEIADRLVISQETVKTHVRRVLTKLGLPSRLELRHLFADWDFSLWDAPRDGDEESL